MFNTDPLTRQVSPQDAARLNEALKKGGLGGSGDSKGITLAVVIIILIGGGFVWMGGWVFPFQARLGSVVATVVAFVVTLAILLIPVGVLWQAIPELFRRRDARMRWQQVALFAEANGMQYLVQQEKVPRSEMMRGDDLTADPVVRAASGPFGETGVYSWSYPDGRGSDGFATSHALYFRLPYALPYAFVRRSGVTRSYTVPMSVTMDGYPPADLGLALADRYEGVALAGYDPRVWDVLTNQLLTTVERLGGDCDVEISEAGLWLHSDQEFDRRDPRFWQAVDAVIANVLALLPGANLPVTPLPLPASPETAGPGEASLRPDPKAPDDSGVSCGGIIAVTVVLQVIGLVLHLVAHWPHP